MNHVVITGADGFIGRNLCRLLTERGIYVTALIMQNNNRRESISAFNNLTIIECDYMHLSMYEPQIEKSPDAFIHLAWDGVRPQDRESLSVQLPNIELALNVLRFASNIKTKKFILPGSTMEYLYNDEIICGEDVPTPQNIYGATKVATRHLCEVLSRQLKLPFIYTIFTGVYGPDRRDNNVIFHVIDSLLNGESPELTALEQKWDYVHIDDLVSALLAICEYGKSGACYPIGHGDNVSLFYYVNIIHALIRPDIPLGIGKISYATKTLPSSCVDISSLYKDTGFKPRIEFKQGIVDVINAIKVKKAGSEKK